MPAPARAAYAAEWARENPALGYGELGIEIETGNVRIGDGKTPYSSLAVSTDFQLTASSDTAYLKLSGGTMTGPIAMGSHKITGLANGSSAQDAATFAQLPVADPSFIVVSPSGSDATGTGSWWAPVATLTKAMTLVTNARLVIYMMPGSYSEAASITWPNNNGVRVIGLGWVGNVTISGPATTPVITVNPTYTAATWQFALENVTVNHTAQVGIEINNANLTNKLMGYFKGVATYMSGSGDAVHVTHTTASQAIRLRLIDCNEMNGLVNFTTKSADDQLRVSNSVLAGGLTTSADAVALELLLLNTVVLTSALTIGDAAHVLTYRGSCYRSAANVYTELVDQYSGAHYDALKAPAKTGRPRKVVT